jgi:SAM-dependent methyltransferase
MRVLHNIFIHNIERSNGSHAILEKKSRVRKANKIQALVETKKDLSRSRVLDIGTGSGQIAHELSKKAKKVISVDLVDERKEKRGYEFLTVKDEVLPFKDHSFDVVITNHVVEHTPKQKTHLSEIMRVLKPNGVIYLATPNKYWLTDPHYKLPFISWLPRSLSQKYLHATQKNQWDIYPLSHFGVKKYIPNSKITNALPLLLKSEAIKTLDTMGRLSKVISHMPKIVLESTRYFSPTLIYLIEKKEQG